MDIHEAIETLKANYPDACYGQLREAVDMAISALEKQIPKKPSEGNVQMPRASDLISRKMAIIQLSHNKTGDDDCDVVIQRDIETIKSLPSMRHERKLGK